MLTTEYMQKYVGGQVEIQNHVENYRYRCQIKSIAIVPDENLAKGPHVPGHGQCATLHVEFDYSCKFEPNVGYKPCENTPYDLSLYISGANDIGDNRLAVSSSIVNEMSVFFPPTHKRRVLADGTMENHE